MPCAWGGLPDLVLLPDLTPSASYRAAENPPGPSLRLTNSLPTRIARWCSGVRD